MNLDMTGKDGQTDIPSQVTPTTCRTRTFGHIQIGYNPDPPLLPPALDLESGVKYQVLARTWHPVYLKTLLISCLAP